MSRDQRGDEGSPSEVLPADSSCRSAPARRRPGRASSRSQEAAVVLVASSTTGRGRGARGVAPSGDGEPGLASSSGLRH